ncbi:TPA: restriction endonuclease subunit S [Yersinia enterocolitica]|nr:restriction endonuclease subunit S [Yersinia enterocolitica]
MAKYKAYPEYKDSGVEWLGDIPVYWGSRPLKFLCTCNDQVISDSTEKDYELEYVDIGSVSSLQGITKTENMIFSNAPSRARRLVKDGDVIISTVRTYLEAIAPIINPPNNMVVSTGFAVIRPLLNLDKGFAAYCLRASGFIKEVVARSVGVSYPAINASDLVNIPIPYCSLYEQSRVAAFLDHETAKIDKLIEKQQQLIELLKEKRQAVISHAVTKGLNPDVPMKDSGVEWLGEVPEHWEASRIGWLCNVGNGCTPSRENALFWQNGSYPWLNSSKVNDERVLTADQFVTPKALSECSLPKVRKGSVIMAITGEGKTRGTSALMMIDATINQHVAYITPRTTNKILPEFIHLWLQSKYKQIRTISAGWGSTKAAITCSDVKSYPIPILPIKEQLEIIKAIEKEKNNFSNLLCICEKQIELLQERRTALISAAVTGKIDVRDWVAPDTHEVEVLQEVTA